MYGWWYVLLCHHQAIVIKDRMKSLAVSFGNHNNFSLPLYPPQLSGTLEDQTARKWAFIEELKTLPVAIQTAAANEQHYEVGLGLLSEQSLRVGGCCFDCWPYGPFIAVQCTQLRCL